MQNETAAGPGPHPELLRFLRAYDARIRELALLARSEVLKHAPAAVELIYDSYNAVAMSYSFTGAMRDGFCHVAAYSNHVNLGFNQGALLSDPHKILKGSGRMVRHVSIQSSADFARPELIAVLRAAIDRAATDMEASGKPPSAAAVRVMKTTGPKRRPKNS